MNDTCGVCRELGRPCNTHKPPPPAPMVKLTPAQNTLVRQLIDSPDGVPLDQVHSKPLEGLMRRRIATVHHGRALLIAPTKQVQMGIHNRTLIDFDALTSIDSPARPDDAA